jgi:tRNA pseudouridine38-40 synthase
MSGTPRRFYLLVHYDGTEFFGWQVQPSERTVQGELEAALLSLTGAPRSIMGSGRTDRGVHATGQVASVALPDRWAAPELLRALNAVLPDDVWVEEVRRVPADFHPRYDATRRSYRYHLGLSALTNSPFHRHTCWPLRRELDPEVLARAASEIEGEHSFHAFAKAGQEERGHHCTVERAEWAPWDDLGLAFTITANRYLHHMVRYLVGTMVEMGLGARPLQDMKALLAGEPGTLETSPPAPPEGLFLSRVEYPPEAIAVVDGDQARAPGLRTGT